jgi:hypothetical protein
MAPEKKRSLLLIVAVVLLAVGILAVARHLMSDRDQIPVSEAKVEDPLRNTPQASQDFTPPRAPVAPLSDEAILSSVSSGTVTIRWEHSPGATATTPYKSVPPPSDHDVATNAEFTLVDGRLPAGYLNPLPCLHDGLMPSNSDQREANFRLAMGSGEGRVKVDLHKPIRIFQINSYSWHNATRGPQLYRVYGSNGSAAGFDPAPRAGVDPATCGWIKIADVDTRPASGPAGGRYAVSISDSSATLGTYRFLLFCMLPTDPTDGGSQTFYSEIDVVE